MNCHAFLAVADLMKEGRLSQRRTVQARAHLDSCAACRAQAASAAPRAEALAPAAFKDRLRRALAAAPAPEGRGSSPALWPRDARAVALAAAALILVGLFIAAEGAPRRQDGALAAAAGELP